MGSTFVTLVAIVLGGLLVADIPESAPAHPEPAIGETKVPAVISTGKIDTALSFCRKNKFDTTIAVLIRYGIHSGKKRGFLVNPCVRTAFDSFLVSHGCGSNAWGSDQSRDNAAFSNAFESHCSSLGKYKIGKRAYSDWGINIKYLLHGLDSTNSNAYKRTIVLHGWGDVPDADPYPSGIPEGWGCPAVSNRCMQKLDSLLQGRKRPVLMWVFE